MKKTFRRKANYPKIIFPILVVVGLLLLGTVKYLPSLFSPADIMVVTGTTVNYLFNPTSSSLNSGATKTVELLLDAKTNKVSAAKAQITFDPTLIQLAAEPQIGTKLAQNIQLTSMAGANSTGKLDIVLGLAPADKGNPPTGQFLIATTQWKTVTSAANKTATIQVNTTNSQVVDFTNPASPIEVPITATAFNFTLNPSSTTTLPTASPSPAPTLLPTPLPTVTPTARPNSTISPEATPTNTPTTPRPTATLRPAPTSSTSSTGNSRTFLAAEDAVIYSNYPSYQGGKAKTLRVDKVPNHNFVLKFVISGLTGTIKKATLRLYNTQGSVNGGSFYTTTNTWSASNLTWSNAPKAYDHLGDLGGVRPGRWYELDVTSYIVGNGTYALRALSNSWDGADYSSSKGLHPPELVISL